MSGDRLQATEIALSHAEAAIDDLSDEVRRQGAEIDALKLEIRRLHALIQRLQDGEPDDKAFVP